MCEAESRGIVYLFKIRRSTHVRGLFEPLADGAGWKDCGFGWQARQVSLKLEGWAGFTTHKLKPCKVMARLIAIVANWWNVFYRIADPTAHREAITSCPAYMSTMDRIVESGRRRTIHLTSTHADSTLIQRALNTVAAFFRWLGSTAGQLDEKTRWTIVVRCTFRRILLPDLALKPLYALK